LAFGEAFLAIRNLFSKRDKDEVVGAKILVASLDPKFAELAKADSDRYSQFYRTPTVLVFESIQELLGTIDRGYDIVHLFCDVSPDGTISDGRGGKILGTAAIQSCCDADVKLLWVASENKAQGYITGFKAAGKRLNLVMTVSRNGVKFPSFLEKLLSRMSAGETMPVAWVSISPQSPKDQHQQDSPSCIFSAGRGEVKLR
jgi:hypothetical protein